MAAWIKMLLGMEVGLGPGDVCVRWDPAPPHQKGGGAPSKFSTHLYRGQTAGWIKMVLGMEVYLSPGDFALDGNPAPPSPKRGRSPQIFGLSLSGPNDWMDQDGTRH